MYVKHKAHFLAYSKSLINRTFSYFFYSYYLLHPPHFMYEEMEAPSD